MKKIFIYWMGGELPQATADNITLLKEQGFDVVIGPSREEHDFLLKNVKYYKMASEKKIYAFMSDVWELYILSKHKGIYIDAVSEIRKDFKDIVASFDKYKSVFFRTTLNMPSLNIIINNEDNSLYFKKLFNGYKKIEKIDNIKIYWSGPQIYYFLLNGLNHLSSDNWDVYSIDGHAYSSLFYLYDKNAFLSIGSASWTTGHKSSEKRRIAKLDLYGDKKKFMNYYLDTINYLKDLDELPTCSPLFARDLYDKTNKKSDLIYIKKAFKEFPFKIPITRKLVWSKLYRIFSFKKAR